MNTKDYLIIVIGIIALCFFKPLVTFTGVNVIYYVLNIKSFNYSNKININIILCLLLFLFNLKSVFIQKNIAILIIINVVLVITCIIDIFIFKIKEKYEIRKRK